MKLYSVCKVYNMFGPCTTGGPFSMNKNSVKETDVVPILM